MNWPPIDVPLLGRSGLIALIALLHIPFFVNFVMGAPVIAVISEWLGKRTGDARYDTLSKHLSIMALVTVGIGALGGIGLVATNIGLFPRFFAAGAGIFFWPLVIEIAFFLIETVFIAVYRYTWDAMKHRPLHMVYGLLAAFGAWGSGLIINGLASFMLTPGRWPETRSVLDAAFNPTSLPSFTHRAVASLSVTGFFLIVYALWQHGRAKNPEGRSYAAWALGYASKWALVATMLQFLPGVWYLTAIEAGTRAAAPEGSVLPKLLGGPLTFYWFGGILLAAGALLLVWFLGVQHPGEGLKRLGKLGLILSVALILTTNAFMGFTRERARKPYLVYGVIYGNQMMTQMMTQMEGGAPAASAAEGEAVFQDGICKGCHTLGGEGGKVGPVLDGVGSRKTAAELSALLKSPPPGMPPFTGSDADREALAAFLAEQK